MQEHIYKHFRRECYKDFLKEASVTFIDKADRKDPEKKKILDASIENNGALWS